MKKQGGRHRADPGVVDCVSADLLPSKIEQAAQLGADLVILDTPPHSDVMARAAVTAADLCLIPCRPQAFDLAAVISTTDLVQSSGRPAFVLFSGGPPRAPGVYVEARALIEGSDGTRGLGVVVAPVMLTQRAVFQHSTAAGKVAGEIEPQGKAAEEIAALWTWTAEQVGLPTGRRNRA